MRFLNLLPLIGALCVVMNIRADFTPYTLASSTNSNSGSVTKLAFMGTINATNVSYVRVHFAEFNLGAASYVRLFSVHDGEAQVLNATAMANWSSMSAIFNGSTLSVQLFVAPGDENVFFKIDGITAEPFLGGVVNPYSKLSLAKTLCGSDNRTASFDNRVGRLSSAGCTGWLISNGGVLTAGHCAPVGGVYEVNVPASRSNGVIVASAVIDQFPVIASGQQSEANNAGADWAVFSLGSNSVSEFAHQKFGFFRITRSRPGAGTVLRITGCGVDNTPAFNGGICCAFDTAGNCTHTNCNAQSQTLQTGTGTFTSESISAARSSLNYAVDTEPANSGSPIIWEANGWAIGIHDAGGCTATGGSNTGTSFEHDPLENGINSLFGANTMHLDFITGPNNPVANGSIMQPYHDFTAAQNAVVSGGRISIVTGTYAVPAGTSYSKAMTLVAPVGNVTIGQ